MGAGCRGREAGGASFKWEARRSRVLLGCSQAPGEGGGGSQPGVTSSAVRRECGAVHCSVVLCIVPLHIWQNPFLLMYFLLMSCYPSFKKTRFEEQGSRTPWICSLSVKLEHRCSWGLQDTQGQLSGAGPPAPGSQGARPICWLRQSQAPHYGASPPGMKTGSSGNCPLGLAQAYPTQEVLSWTFHSANCKFPFKMSLRHSVNRALMYFTSCSRIAIKQYCHSVSDTAAVGISWWCNNALLLSCPKNFGWLAKRIADKGQSTVIHTLFYGLVFLLLWHEMQEIQHKGFYLLERRNAGTQEENPWWYAHKYYSAYLLRYL